MQLTQLIIIVVLILSLAIQAISLAAMGYGTTAYTYYDTQFPSSSGSATQMQSNMGYIVYVLIGASLSSLIYIYLILSKILSFKNETIDWWCQMVVCFLQFAIAVVFAVDLKNIQLDYAAVVTLLTPFTTAPFSTTLTYFKTTHALQIAAAVLSFVIGFCGGLYLLARQTLQLKSFLSSQVTSPS